jgi:hypothetical protein
MALLNVLSSDARSDADYVRLLARSLHHWLAHLADEADLEVAVAYASGALGSLPDAATCSGLHLPPGIAPAAAVEQCEAYFSRAGLRPLRYILHPDLTAADARTLSSLLEERGYQQRKLVAYAISRFQASAAVLDEVTIIPARASYRHTVALAQECAASLPAAKVEEAQWLHLDDARYDALVALDAAGRPAASAGMLAIGDVGLLRELRVSKSHEGTPLSQVMLERAMEIAARSLFKHVLAAADASDPVAEALSVAGFRAVGHLVTYEAKPAS